MELNRPRLVLAAALVAVCSACLLAQPEPEELPGWILGRLATLEPDDPAAYFLLGEEVATEMRSKVEEQLAAQLFGLAYELDLADRVPTWIAPSSCLALASIARLESDERWLRALASRLDPRYAAPAWRGPTGTGAVTDAAIHTAEAVGEARAGMFPLDENAKWEKNAAALKQLASLRERIRTLEAQLKINHLPP